MMTQSAARVSASRGFTLIELMITLVIATVLIVIAIPAYTKQIQKSRRTDAKTALLDLASREERLLSTTNAYSSVPANLGYTVGLPITIGSGYYQISAITVPNPAVVVANPPPSFIITAVAIGSQLKDTQCQTFTVDSNGNQVSKDNSGAVSTATCWG